MELNKDQIDLLATIKSGLGNACDALAKLRMEHKNIIPAELALPLIQATFEADDRLRKYLRTLSVQDYKCILAKTFEFNRVMPADQQS